MSMAILSTDSLVDRVIGLDQTCMETLYRMNQALISNVTIGQVSIQKSVGSLGVGGIPLLVYGAGELVASWKDLMAMDRMVMLFGIPVTMKIDFYAFNSNFLCGRGNANATAYDYEFASCVLFRIRMFSISR